MADKFLPLAADPYRFLMEVYDHEGRLMDVRTPSLPPDYGGKYSGPMFRAFTWARDYLERTPSAARIRISSLWQVCWVGGTENK